MAYVTIPLTTEPDQSFICTVPVDGKNISLLFRLRYNTQGGYWWLGLSDPNTAEQYLDSLPLLPAMYPAANLLPAYMELGSAYVVPTGTNITGSPDDTNLGADYVLVWGDTAM